MYHNFPTLIANHTDKNLGTIDGFLTLHNDVFVVASLEEGVHQG